MKTEKTIVVDAAGGALGRVASYAAKAALLNNKVIIVNCNGALITGQKANIMASYHQTRIRGGTAQRGPYFSKTPEKIMKRTVRGMLPYRQGRGLDALKRVICYNDVPKEFENVKKESMAKELKTKAIKLSEVSRLL